MAENASGASLTYPKQCSALRKGDHVLVKDHPIKIVDLSTSKTGKHGHAKVHLTGMGIFDGKKYEDICPSTHNMNCPIVNRIEYQAVAVDKEDKMIEINEEDGTQREIKLLDADLLGKIEKEIEDEGDCWITILCAMNEEKVIGIKNRVDK